MADDTVRQFAVDCIDVKIVFTFFNVFNFVNVFLFFKLSVKIPPRSSRSTFEATETN